LIKRGPVAPLAGPTRRGLRPLPEYASYGVRERTAANSDADEEPPVPRSPLDLDQPPVVEVDLEVELPLKPLPDGVTV
jgi:hypothetical protein